MYLNNIDELECFLQKTKRRSNAQSTIKTETVSTQKQKTDAYKKTLQLLNRKDYTVNELKNKLISYEFDSNEITEAIDLAISQGYLSDERYTYAYLQSKLNQGFGFYYAKRKLIQKGVDISLIETVYEELAADGPIAEEEHAAKLLEKWHSSSKNQYQAAYNRLLRKGYTSSTASKVVKQHFSSEQN